MEIWREIFIKGIVHCILFLIEKMEKQPKCLIIGDWLNKLWCIDMIEYL